MTLLMTRCNSRVVHTDSTFPLTMMLKSTYLLPKYLSLLTLPWSLHVHDRDRGLLLPRLRLAKTTNQTASMTIPTVASPSPSYLSLPPWTFTNTSHPLASHRSFFLSSPRQYIESRRAFAQHKSQGKWFRRLWLLTSRYMWWNELERIVPVSRRTV